MTVGRLKWSQEVAIFVLPTLKKVFLVIETLKSREVDISDYSLDI